MGEDDPGAVSEVSKTVRVLLRVSGVCSDSRWQGLVFTAYRGVATWPVVPTEIQSWLTCEMTQFL